MWGLHACGQTSLWPLTSWSLGSSMPGPSCSGHPGGVVAINNLTLLNPLLRCFFFFFASTCILSHQRDPSPISETARKYHDRVGRLRPVPHKRELKTWLYCEGSGEGPALLGVGGFGVPPQPGGSQETPYLDGPVGSSGVFTQLLPRGPNGQVGFARKGGRIWLGSE